jgi:hypothetical protein
MIQKLNNGQYLVQSKVGTNMGLYDSQEEAEKKNIEVENSEKGGNTDVK